MKVPVKLTRYNADHHSGVVAYGVFKQGIIIQFQKGEYYFYDEKQTGASHIKEMVKRAQQGAALSTYISQHPDVRSSYKVTARTLEELLNRLP